MARIQRSERLPGGGRLKGVAGAAEAGEMGAAGIVVRGVVCKGFVWKAGSGDFVAFRVFVVFVIFGVFARSVAIRFRASSDRRWLRPAHPRLGEPDDRDMPRGCRGRCSPPGSPVRLRFSRRSHSPHENVRSPAFEPDIPQRMSDSDPRN